MNRILIIRTGAIGDIVLATAVLEALFRAYPRACLEFLLKKRFAGLLEEHPHIARLWLLDEKGDHRGTRGLMLFLRKIQREEFDLVIDLQDNFRSRLICGCVRAGKKLRWNKLAWQRRLLTWFKKRTGAVSPVYRRYLETLKPLGLKIDDIHPRLYTGPIDGDRVPIPYIAIAPGAHWATKRWPAEYFTQLIKRVLAETQFNVAIIGSSEDSRIGQAIAAISSERIVDLCGELKLNELMAVISHAAVLVTNDTGPMHMAEALGVPVLAFFGPTVREFGFAPWRPESRVLERDLDCRPCRLHGGRSCPQKHFRCLLGIDPEQAWVNLRDMIHAGR